MPEPSVLIVEDEASIAHLLDVLVRRKGYGARIVGNGLHAIQAIEQSRPDVILLDLIMPVMSGYQLIDRLQSDPDTADIPVVLVTTEENIDHERPPAREVVLKPFSPMDLYGALERVLSSLP